MPPSPELRLLAELCSCPTVPFAESAVLEFVCRWARRRRLHLARDASGNLLVSTLPPGRLRPGQRRLVLAAHTDHPGFVAHARDGRTLTAHFRGGVRADHVMGAAVRFYPDPAAPGVRGRVVATAGEPYPVSALVELPGNAPPLPPGTPGMFDLTPARFTRTHFHSRACDDLAGAAAALAALDAIARRKPPTPVAVLLTRAEEVGFIGALAAVMDRSGQGLLRKRHDLLLAIECSAEQPYARQHDGVVLRVGDRTSIFNSSLTAFLADTARALAERDPDFRYQRALMPGGTCESTVYDAWGYHAAAVCVPLGNYHNMPPTPGLPARTVTRSSDRPKAAAAPARVAAEHISLADYRNMVKLFIALAEQAHTYRPGHVALKQRLTQRFRSLRPLLQRAAGPA